MSVIPMIEIKYSDWAIPIVAGSRVATKSGALCSLRV